MVSKQMWCELARELWCTEEMHSFHVVIGRSEQDAARKPNLSAIHHHKSHESYKKQHIPGVSSSWKPTAMEAQEDRMHSAEDSTEALRQRIEVMSP